MQRMAIVHTNLALVTPLGELSKEMLPEVEIVHIIDDDLLRYARRTGVDSHLTRRMCTYFQQAHDAGVDLILSACSSVGETVDIARQLVPTPILKIDEPMAYQAVERSGTVAVLATVESTLHPTCRLLERTAREAGKEIEVLRFLNDGALDYLVGGDVEKHDEMVTHIAEEAARQADVLLFAQGSMARLAPTLQKRLGKPVLSSPRAALAEAERLLVVAAEGKVRS